MMKPSVSSEILMISKEIVRHSNDALARSAFFSRLNRGEVSMENLRYVFKQYEYWRNSFHTWFGLCILKSGDASDPTVSKIVEELAHHTWVEMKENHARMYQYFMRQLGPQEGKYSKENKATLDYKSHFVKKFGVTENNFKDAVAALSARELFASIRNTWVLAAFRSFYNIEKTPWWDAHEHLELEHFQDIFAPLSEEFLDKTFRDNLLRQMREEIDAHVRYWDALLDEASMAPGA